MEDASIEEYEHHEYEPITGTNLNNPGEIRINIETQDLYSPKKVMHNFLVYRQVHIIVAVTCVLYISVIPYKE